MRNYEWKFCSICEERIFKDEVEEDTVKTVDGVLYCIDCADGIES